MVSGKNDKMSWKTLQKASSTDPKGDTLIAQAQCTVMGYTGDPCFLRRGLDLRFSKMGSVMYWKFDQKTVLDGKNDIVLNM